MPAMPGPPTAFSALTVAGVPTIGAGGLPPFTGSYFFVNETTGSDGNTGDATSPFKTLYRAQQAATANQNDVVFLTGTAHLSPTLDYVSSAGPLLWAKNQVHLIGLCDPLKHGKRARISVTGSTPFGPLVNVTASGCWFMNFGTFFGFTTTGSTSPICWQDTGGRNCYDTVEFLGFGDATVSTGTAVQTGARAFKLNTSTGETTWRNCVFGVDTVARNATNYTLEIAGGAPRCTINNCDFEADLGSSGTASSHILVGASGIDRYLLLENSRFLCATKSGGSTMAQAFNVNASAGGVVLMDQCVAFGITAWETTPSNSVYTNMSAVSAPGGGIALVL